MALVSDLSLPISVDPEQVTAFCHKWQVRELALFGSVLRSDFSPDSDIDVLVEFEPEAPWSLLDWVTMTEELKGIFGRPVDLVEKDAIRNPFRRDSILSTYRAIYAA